MKLPSSVKIGVYTYEVKEVDGPILVNGRTCTGSIAYEDLVIEILKEMPYQRKMQTLFHEIQHGLYDSVSISYEKSSEEEITDCLATGWLMLMMDNPDLLTTT